MNTQQTYYKMEHKIEGETLYETSNENSSGPWNPNYTITQIDEAEYLAATGGGLIDPVKEAITKKIGDGISYKHALALLTLNGLGNTVYSSFNNGNEWVMGRNTAYGLCESYGLKFQHPTKQDPTVKFGWTS